MRNRWRLLFVLALTLGALVVVWPSEGGFSIPLPSGSFTRENFKLGLDLQGGTHLVLQGDMSKVPEGDRESAIRGVLQVIERRINASRDRGKCGLMKYNFDALERPGDIR